MSKQIIGITAGIFLVLSGLAGGFYRVSATDIREGGAETDETGNKPVVFSIVPGASLNDIAAALKREGLISNEFLFRVYVFFKGVSASLQAGDYDLSAAMSFSDIVQKLRTGDTIKIGVTVFEGSDIGEVEASLNAGFSNPRYCGQSCSKKVVLSYFQTKDFKDRFSFLADAPDTATLEGYLYPDTYVFTGADDHDSIARKMLKTFEARLSPDVLTQIRRQNRTVFEVITMASLIEKEVRGTSDKKMVAGIIMNRLEARMPLQIDATLAYITDKRTTRFSVSDTKIDSPYNTYVYRGLPKGPICNPGLESILAAVYPKNNDYFFYLSTPAGQTIFSKNFGQHLVAKRTYLK